MKNMDIIKSILPVEDFLFYQKYLQFTGSWDYANNDEYKPEFYACSLYNCGSWLVDNGIIPDDSPQKDAWREYRRQFTTSWIMSN